MRYLLAAVLLTAVVSSAVGAEPVRVLIVTGVDHPGHPWKATAPLVKKILEEDARMKADIDYDFNVLASEKIHQYDTLFLHFKNYKPAEQPEKLRANLTKFVTDGGGIVAFHFSCGAFEDWPEFAQIIGKVWDRKTGHDARGPFTVELTDHKHPITAGMEDFAADDELYICLVGDRPVELLATARSKKTGRDHPMAFVFTHGKGRVFNSPLGHDVKAIEMPGVAELTRRGTAWTAGLDPVAKK
ncbi:MAG: ThuA domain-containing protein [Planctomycetes bacterium]|nr:ThuA domain-containing protein [Planctomycetota bacterium]